MASAKSIKEYRSWFLKCMNYSFGTSHPKDYDFTTEELLELKPEHIYAFMANQVYGKPNPSDDDKPLNGRSSTLEYMKKAISFFMPNKLAGWNVETRSGNPTRSVEINELIKTVKKKEVRKEGKASSARRPMEQSEFRELIRRLRESNKPLVCRTLSAYFIYQYNMIGRVDDVAHFTVEDINPNVQYNFVLQSRMKWSKNVLEEREAPDQVVFGAGDPMYCAQLALAIHLEHSLMDGTMNKASASQLLFGVSKGVASKSLRDTIFADDFPRVDDKPLGTHSIRKLPSTYARRNGCQRDDIDSRGRWKRQKHTSDEYIDVALPYPDAKVATVLCIGGAIMYDLKEGVGISDEWLLQNVSCNIGILYPRPVAVVFGKALLWGVFDEDVSKLMDQRYVDRVRTAFARVDSNTLDEGVCPVRKVPLVIHNDDGNMVISTLDDMEDEEEVGAENVRENGRNEAGRNVRRRIEQGGNSEVLNQVSNLIRCFHSSIVTHHIIFLQIRLLKMHVVTLMRQNEEMKNDLHLFRVGTNSHLRNVHTCLRRVALRPSQPRIRSNNNSGGASLAAGVGGSSQIMDPHVTHGSNISKLPKTLYVLWNEWEFGIGGNKPAKLFLATERGRVKYQYSLRKVFWDLCSEMIRRGHTSDTAIDEMYKVYSNRLSLTQILRKMREDRKRGGHPLLRSSATIDNIIV